MNDNSFTSTSVPGHVVVLLLVSCTSTLVISQLTDVGINLPPYKLKPAFEKRLEEELGVKPPPRPDEERPILRWGLVIRNVVLNFTDGLVPAGLLIGAYEFWVMGCRKTTRGERLWFIVGALWILGFLLQVIIVAAGSLVAVNALAIPNCLVTFLRLIVIPTLAASALFLGRRDHSLPLTDRLGNLICLFQGGVLLAIFIFYPTTRPIS